MLIKFLLYTSYILRVGDTVVNETSPWIWIICGEKLIYFRYKESSTFVRCDENDFVGTIQNWDHFNP